LLKGWHQICRFDLFMIKLIISLVFAKKWSQIQKSIP
jgi:hypothetical protein